MNTIRLITHNLLFFTSSLRTYSLFQRSQHRQQFRRKADNKQKPTSVSFLYFPLSYLLALISFLPSTLYLFLFPSIFPYFFLSVFLAFMSFLLTIFLSFFSFGLNYIVAIIWSVKLTKNIPKKATYLFCCTKYFCQIFQRLSLNL